MATKWTYARRIIRRRYLLLLRSAWVPSPVRVLLYRLAGAKIGAKVKLAYGFYANLPRHLSIGEGTHVNQEVTIDCEAARVDIGRRVLVGWRSTLVTGSHDPNDPWTGTTGKPIVVEDGAWTGAQCLVLPGVSLGAGAVVAGGAVVTKSVAPRDVVGGNPARVLRSLPPNVDASGVQ